jgi:hypothetical protein
MSDSTLYLRVLRRVFPLSSLEGLDFSIRVESRRLFYLFISQTILCFFVSMFCIRGLSSDINGPEPTISWFQRVFFPIARMLYVVSVWFPIVEM